MISDAFSYPLRGSGRIILVIGSLLSLFLGLGTFAPLLGFVAFMLGMLYLLAYFCDIITTTVGGSEDPPDWPEISDLFSDILAPALRVLGALLVSFIPMLAVRALTGDSPAALPAVWAAMALGAFYFPMAVLNTLISGEFSGALPHRVFPEIRETMPRYLLAAGLFFAVMLISSVFSALGSKVPYLGPLLASALSLYFMMVQGRVLGMIFRTGAEDDDVEALEAAAVTATAAPAASVPSAVTERTLGEIGESGTPSAG